MENKSFIDLHCHLDGSLSPETVRELLPPEELPADDAGLLALLQVSPRCRDLTEYLEKFALPLKGLQTAENLKLAAYRLIADASRDDLRYLEIRFAPALSTDAGLDCAEVIDAVLSGVREGERAFGLPANLIVCAMRHHSFEKNAAMLQAARDFLGKGVVALDLAGDENRYPTAMHAELFLRAKAMGFPFTIHSGEQGSVENVALALDLGAKRLGHGIALRKAPALMEKAKEMRAGIEMCPTSNLQTKAVASFDDYPMGEFLRRGLLVTVNTDNRTVSGTTSARETAIALKLCGGTFPDLADALFKNAVAVSFADDSLKNRLLREAGFC
ncbi:MAG: adenosine deaminase [Fusobacteriaceae bacterium]|jgi:adenosine deaminase|nr:adenosine deaminase [Fusobacteriaceae bacterium]